MSTSSIDVNGISVVHLQNEMKNINESVLVC